MYLTTWVEKNSEVNDHSYFPDLFSLHFRKIKNKSYLYFDGKVQLFWEGHKNLRKLPHGFDVKAMRKIVQIFVAFSEKKNLN